MTKDEALKLALEALELIGMKNWSLREDKAITAIKEALANEALEKKAENARELGLDYEPEPVEVDQATMELAESVGLIGPTSRTHDLHYAIQRFHDLICVNATIKAAQMAANAIREATSPAQQEPVAWVYPEGLEALKAGKPWTAYGTRQEPNNTALYLSPQPDIPPYAWVTFTPYGDEDDVWYENPEGQLLEGWTYKPLYDTTPPQQDKNEFKPDWDEKLALTEEVIRLSKRIEELEAKQEPWRESASDYERGVVDGRQMQVQSSVDKAVNTMTQRTWVGLTDEEILENCESVPDYDIGNYDLIQFARAIEAKLKEKNT